MCSDVSYDDLKLSDTKMKHLVVVLPGDCKEGPCVPFGPRTRPRVKLAS